MSKKSSGLGIIGTILAAGAVLGIYKYIQDYSSAVLSREEEIDGIRSDAVKVKDAAKRTYVAIREKADVKEAAAELANAAGSVASDAAGIVKTAGTGVYDAAKEIKTKFDDDPQAAREEVLSNIRDIGSGIKESAGKVASDIADKFSSDDLDDIFEEAEKAAEQGTESFKEEAADLCSNAADLDSACTEAVGTASQLSEPEEVYTVEPEPAPVPAPAPEKPVEIPSYRTIYNNPAAVNTDEQVYRPAAVIEEEER